jgi:outer membrane protein OmpA-like peptidoglycan-associated protein
MPVTRLPLQRITRCLLGLAVTALSTLATTGCGFVLFGMGTGAFTGAYVAGDLKQTYASGYPEAVRASTETLNELKVPVAEGSGDEAKTTIKGRRSDGTPIEVTVTKIDEKQTEIGVRTGYVGVWDREASRQIHSLIAERLARKPPGQSAPAEIEPPPAALKPEPPPVEEPQPPKKKAPPPPKAPSRASAPAAAAPSAEPAKPEAKASYHAERTLFFPSGTNELPPQEVEKLDRVAAALRANPEAVVSLHGYSDSSGNASQNFLLSVGRAEAAKRYLAEKGCSPDQVLVIGHGAVNFLGSNDSEAGRRLNRRVEIELHNGQ